MIIPITKKLRLKGDGHCWHVQVATRTKKAPWRSISYHESPIAALRSQAMKEVRELDNTMAFHQAIEMMLELFDKYESILKGRLVGDTELNKLVEDGGVVQYDEAGGVEDDASKH